MSTRTWDVLVIGAGPAGAMAARQAAAAGASTLLLDKSDFPRHKVCGCCLNASALEQLSRAGLSSLPVTLGARPLHCLRLRGRRRSVDLSLPSSVAVSRRVLDAELVRCAVAAGAVFRPRMNARVGAADEASRIVDVRSGRSRWTLRGRVVIAAHGLGGHALDDLPSFRPAVRERSCIGIQAMMTGDKGWLPEGVILMHCGNGGYVGAVRLEDGQVDIAGALDPRFVREQGSPGRAILSLLEQTGTDAAVEVAGLPWKGTPLLTRRSEHVAGARLLLVGDAIGYVEPFTGEGISWALATGAVAGAVAAAAGEQWDVRTESEWRRTCRSMLAAGHLRCLAVTRLLRRPVLRAFAFSILARSPQLASPMIKRMSRGPRALRAGH